MGFNYVSGLSITEEIQRAAHRNGLTLTATGGGCDFVTRTAGIYTGGTHESGQDRMIAECVFALSATSTLGESPESLTDPATVVVYIDNEEWLPAAAFRDDDIDSHGVPLSSYLEFATAAEALLWMGRVDPMTYRSMCLTGKGEALATQPTTHPTTRDKLIAMLEADDRNGTFSDEDHTHEFGRPMTDTELIAEVCRLLQAGAE